jgi:hypothetical protein
MIKKLIILAIALLLSGCACCADDNLNNMNDALGKGYELASKNNARDALYQFKTAATYASKAKSWRGLIDAANAFSALGQPKDGLHYLNEATAIARLEKDWRGLVASGYAYAALPEKLKASHNADSCFTQACEIALKNDDWRGISEGAKGLEKIGNISAANQYRASADKLKNDIQTATPPPGWQPAAPSIAGTKKVSMEAQLANRRAADGDIERKNQWLLEQQKKENARQQYSYKYVTYYGYPYYYTFYSRWSTLSNVQTSVWATYYLARYRYNSGVYVYVGL